LESKIELTINLEISLLLLEQIVDCIFLLEILY